MQIYFNSTGGVGKIIFLSMSSCADALKAARSYLQATSQRESSWGIPVGAILMKKSNAGLLKKSWHEAQLGKIGIKKFQDIHGVSDYAVVHIATHTAAKVAALQDCGDGHRVESVLSALEGEYFPSVRIHDPYFELKQLKTAPPDCEFTFGEIFAGAPTALFIIFLDLRFCCD